ncbi:MAG: hypothetical protein E7658_08025 [Ruminococcaceae bacterium]|nr:hypothetical protein [Oscillospiraceae bacterium]
MDYIGRWKFHSIGVLNEKDEFEYLDAQAYLESPMPYVDETDEEAVADELRERQKMIRGEIAVCEGGKMYMLLPLPDGVSREEVDRAVQAGHIKLYDGMMTDDPMTWEERDGELWFAVSPDMSEEDSRWAKGTDGEFLVFMTTRYTKAE